MNATTGWAVGDDGTILSTNNGGATWQAQTSGTTSSIMSVHFVNATTGWAVCGDEYRSEVTILVTKNGGTTWQEQVSGTRSWLLSVHFVNATTGWVVGEHGTILTTRDSGATWQAQASGRKSELESIHFVNAMTGWAVGDGGTILTTRDSGATWQAQASVTRSWLHAVHFVDAMTGWAVGGYFPLEVMILVTSNGGVTWKTQTSGTMGPLNAVHFINPTTGWAVGVTLLNETTILVTNNGGATWQAQTSGISSSLNSVHFVNATTGWAVGDDGTILSTNNGGATWQAQTSGISSSLNSVHFVNATTGWAVGSGGTILVTSNGGATWQVQTSGTTNGFNSVHFVNATTGWAVGDKGTILATNNGGTTWQAQTSRTESWLSHVFFVSAATGWAVGGYGTILSTKDGGQTWNPIKYSRSFAPWYYLTWFFIAPLLYLAFRKPKPIEAEQKTVADMLVSDRPIAAGDPDPLEFNSIARGLSRFLRNENTQPPLTIAITGEWGSGKSSLMNLLKADLERYGFRPVWFNAWHHQKEEHLLAALLQNIRKQAVPSLWHRGGLVFRSRLLWERTRRYWALALLLLALFSFAVGYFVVDHPNRMHQAWEQAGEIEKDLFAFLFSKTAPDSASSPQNAERVESAKDEKEKRVSFFTLLLSTLGSLFVLWRWLRAFGVDPASLMASISDKARLRDLKAQMGFRHDFAREFSEVTVALNPRTMLILIDDLDRCRPENVLEVLEAVNFLVSSGDCFVVMGLDLTRVERCVGLGFKDVAEELVDDPAQEANKDVGKSRREKFARQYLEKLINIEVPVPQPQAQQSQYLIVPPEPIAPRPLTWWQNLFQVSAPIVRKVAPVLLVAGVLIGSTWFSVKYFSPQREEPSATTAAPATTQSPTASNQPTPSTPITSSPRRDTPADSARGSGELIQPQKEPASFAFVYIALAIMIGLGIWRLSIPTDLVVKDSPEFIDALKIWHPLLIAKRNTPRSVKRFVNRVRYFAMRQSSETEEKSVWQKLAVWAGFKQKEEAKQVEAVPESILVALSAIHHYEPELLDKVDEMADGAHIAVEVKAVALRQAIRDHIEKFGNWPPSDEDKALLVKISAGVQVN
ncbi:hypothetical protein HUU05_13945 [candidate division KSB1 bacterium]|nr:hypothetical protein [candidate division KSB1 bacterium]